MTVALAGALGRAQAMEIIAHRGASANAPENTLAAVNLAWKESADAVEIDLRLSKDGKLVVIHDEDTKRVAGKPAPVGAQTMDELRALDVGAWKDPTWAGEKIPTFDDVLAAVPAGKKLFVEMKCGKEVIPEIAKAIKDSGRKPEQVTIIGFSMAAMQAAKQALPEHPVLWLVEMKKDKQTGQWKPSAEEMIAKAKKAGMSGINLAASAAINADLVKKVHEAGLTLGVWTVDASDEARRYKDLGVNYLTTNRPGWMREQINSPAAGPGEQETP
ncbi:MAG: glycerophosphodiester phosphodiesterase [Planctomycetota bacterium]